MAFSADPVHVSIDHSDCLVIIIVGVIFLALNWWQPRR